MNRRGHLNWRFPSRCNHSDILPAGLKPKGARDSNES